ncbi:MAG: hypothetical protein WA057_01575 [Candidatus Magasanikiibacteriota bacterium]
METIRRQLYQIDWGKVADVGAFLALMYLCTMAVAVSAITFSSLQRGDLTVVGVAFTLMAVALVSMLATFAADRDAKIFWWFFGGFSLEALTIFFICFYTHAV